MSGLRFAMREPALSLLIPMAMRPQKAHHRSLALGAVGQSHKLGDAVRDRHAAFGVLPRMPPR
jgi:hypothetical protein